MFTTCSDIEAYERIAIKIQGNRKADWMEKAAVSLLSSGKDFSIDGLSSLYDEIQKYRP